MSAKPEVLYFGCIGEPGHYLWRPGSRMTVPMNETPWGIALDTGLCKRPDSINGKTWLYYDMGWTAVAFWDRSVDARGNSCGVFLAKAELSEAELLALAREQWPEVWNRPRFALRLNDWYQPAGGAGEKECS